MKNCSKNASMFRYYFLALLVCCFFIMGCSASNKNDATKYSDSLIVVIGAKDIRYTKFEGTDQVIYIIEADYPATPVLQEISQNLKSKGWYPLREDYFNPGLPSSHVRGWTHFLDATKKPKKEVYQWLAQWENKNKDILWCTLWYSYPVGGSADLTKLTVSLSFMPSTLAIEARKQLLDIAQNNRKQNPNKALKTVPE